MSNFSDSEQDCRVDLWKPSGKWYTTKVLRWQIYDGDIHEALKLLMEKQYPTLKGFSVTCLHPYHKDSHPVMINV
jgi:hypothetical protein